MTKRMLIDSTHAEETRVAVLEGNRLEEYDVETSTKQQLKGNIYLAKVVRVEPSLQAAFVEYGGNRHGFLAFGEIHPDYYQIPIADRRRLLEAQEAEAREDEEAAEREAERASRHDEAEPEAAEPETDDAPFEPIAESPAFESSPEAELVAEPAIAEVAPELPDAGMRQPETAELDPVPPASRVAQPAVIAQDILVAAEEAAELFPHPESLAETEDTGADMAPEAAGVGEQPDVGRPDFEQPDVHPSSFAPSPEEAEFDSIPAEPPEQIGGELEVEEQAERRAPPRFLRHYKIQEVIRRRQIMLVQVVKEERGTKGAALTTYISLAGRFSVLMPNSPRGGGISRKITSAADRRRLKEVTAELDLPRGMGLIIRTAGANRPKPEILRDCEYLLGQWDQIRDLTMKSMAPALIYEEASLIKRAIRDVYSRDVDEILVDGEQGWRAARDFMRMLMPTHARKVQMWRDPQPLFAKAQVETQLDAMMMPTVQLRSGGYLVINQTEALVAIDVNSGRSTRERGIEETALRTNLEAADEAARQLRLRDLAGLIVIDFIDMESRRNVASVERRLKEALKQDRARIQVGSISHFGLLEMSRQRLRPSLTETSFILCPHCNGTGHIRSTESAALHVLRQIEEEGGKRRAAEIVVHCAGSIALYVLNHKRLRLAEIEQRHGMLVSFGVDELLIPPAARIDRVRAQVASELPPPISQLPPPEPFEDPDELEAEPDEVEEDEPEGAATAETADEREQRPNARRRRRRRGGRREEGVAASIPAAEEPQPEEAPVEAEAEAVPAEARTSETEDGERRRRGRRGGRRRRREPGEGEAAGPAVDGAGEESELAEPEIAPPVPAYFGPTPADPFGGTSTFDIFDAIEQQEQELAAAPRPVPVEPPVPVPMEAAQEPAPQPVMEPEPVIEPVPEQVIEVEAVVAEPEPALPLPAAPVIAPVLVGADAAPAEKKRGWWRR